MAGCNSCGAWAQRWFKAIAAAVVALSLHGAPAGAQDGFLDFLFGRPGPARPTPPLPLGTPPGTPLTIDPASPQYGHGTGRINAYCVRLCDGRYFPMPRGVGLPNSSPARVCNALCPASPTRIYVGSDIHHAVAPNGTPYSALPTAFLYRQQLAADCTCNGRDVFGLASVDPLTDPTLRRGDIVSTLAGLQVYTGSRPGAPQTFTFRPIDDLPTLTIIVPRRPPSGP